MALSAQRKASVTTMEYGAFMMQTGNVKGYQQEQYAYNGQTCTIFKDLGDTNAATKAAAVKLAVKTIVDKGVALPPNLKVYCVGAYEAQNRAFHRDPAWQAISVVILGYAACVGGRADALSATIPVANPTFNKPTITCIHEIGHVLHARIVGDDFFDTAVDWTTKPVTSGEVSGYAGQNRKEFVAEVFAGLICGLTYSQACINEYNTLRGPAVP